MRYEQFRLYEQCEQRTERTVRIVRTVRTVHIVRTTNSANGSYCPNSSYCSNNANPEQCKKSFFEIVEQGEHCDKTEYTERELNQGVWRLYQDKLYQTSTSYLFPGGSRNVKITRNAFTTRKNEESGWMCGTVFETTKCYSFNGEKFREEPELVVGRTDGAQMIDSSEVR